MVELREEVTERRLRFPLHSQHGKKNVPWLVDTTLRWLAFFHFTYVSTRSPIYHVKASQSQRLLESKAGRETRSLKSRALQSSVSFVSQLFQGDHQRARASKENHTQKLQPEKRRQWTVKGLPLVLCPVLFPPLKSLWEETALKYHL